MFYLDCSPKGFVIPCVWKLCVSQPNLRFRSALCVTAASTTRACDPNTGWLFDICLTKSLLAKCSVGLKAGKNGTGPSRKQGKHKQQAIKIFLLIH